MNSPVQIVSSDGEMLAQPSWFEEDERLGSQSVAVVSVLGGQGSGKSTLLNKLFGTFFAVQPKGALGSTTTKGICVSKAADDELTVVFDVEGADARERGKSGKQFMTNCAGFAATLSDVIIINTWYHDLGRLDSAPYVCLEAVFKEQLKSVVEGETVQSKLVFAVRDTDEDVSEADVKSQVATDAQELWEKIGGSGEVSAVFDMDVFVLPHIRHSAAAFDEKIAEYASRFKDGSYFQTKFSKGIPAEGLASYAMTCWDKSFKTTSAINAVSSGAGDVALGGSSDAIMSSDAAFSKALEFAKSKMSGYGSKLDDGEKIPGFGQACQDIVTESMQIMSDETADFEDDPSVRRKKAELVSILETALHALFLKQLQVLRSNAIATFKAGLGDDSPTDFVFFQVDSSFKLEAEESIMPGSNWSYESEHAFLLTIMEDASNQRKRLQDREHAAAQEAQQAFRFIQMQEGRIHQIQQQHYGGVSGSWNVGAAYRPPDSNVNISVGYQQGRTNIQISMVPDEQSSLLGPNGFTSGVGPANLGLSFNINV